MWCSITHVPILSLCLVVSHYKPVSTPTPAVSVMCTPVDGDPLAFRFGLGSVDGKCWQESRRWKEKTGTYSPCPSLRQFTEAWLCPFTKGQSPHQEAISMSHLLWGPGNTGPLSLQIYRR